MLLDTTFVIDIEREVRRNKPGDASALLAQNAEEPLYISVVTIAEFTEGFPPERARQARELLAGYTVVDVAEPVAEIYAVRSRAMRSAGTRIGENDLWIAATALHLGMPVATRNAEHFRRVEGLVVRAY